MSINITATDAFLYFLRKDPLNEYDWTVLNSYMFIESNFVKKYYAEAVKEGLIDQEVADIIIDEVLETLGLNVDENHTPSGKSDNSDPLNN